MGWGWRDATCGNSLFSAQSFCKPKTALKKKENKVYLLKRPKKKRERERVLPALVTRPHFSFVITHWLASYYQSQGASTCHPSGLFKENLPELKTWRKQLARTRKQPEPKDPARPPLAHTEPARPKSALPILIRQPLTTSPLSTRCMDRDALQRVSAQKPH